MEGEGNVSKAIDHSYFACKNLEIRIVGKIKSVNLEGCKKCIVYVDSVISEVNLMNCNAVKVYAMEQLQSCTVESSTEINLMLTHKTKNCKLFTICTKSMWIQFPKDGADDTDYDQVNWWRQPVAEIYETKIVGSGIETVPSESLE